MLAPFSIEMSVISMHGAWPGAWALSRLHARTHAGGRAGAVCLARPVCNAKHQALAWRRTPDPKQFLVVELRAQIKTIQAKTTMAKLHACSNRLWTFGDTQGIRPLCPVCA